MSLFHLQTPPRALVGLLLLIAANPIRARGDDGPSSPTPEPTLLIGQPVSEYQTRRKALMKLIREKEDRRDDSNGDTAGLVVVLVGQVPEPLDEAKYRQKSNFAYLTGVEVPNAALILLPSEDRDTLYLPPNRHSGFSKSVPIYGPGPETAEKLGFAQVKSTSRFLGDLFTAIGDNRVFGKPRTVVYTLLKEDGEGPRQAETPFVKFLREGAPTTQFKELSQTLAKLRQVKSAAELSLLKEAIAITGSAQEAVIRTIRPGLFEYQLEAKVLEAFTDRGSRRPGFSAIIGSGPNSTIPHYFANNRKIEDGDLVVVDIGAEYQYYTADITRTYPANGTFTPRQREIYQLVLDAQQAAADHIKTGETKLMELTGWVSNYFKKSPLRAKGEDGNEHTMDYFFIHGLGHHLGLDVHDDADYSKPLQIGEVFTIEPGLYIPSENLGVRIEDDYVLTDHGLEKLSKDIPSDPDEIERQIAKARAARDAAVPASVNGDGKRP
jgi:Xaa-Pro aminopeptidase